MVILRARCFDPGELAAYFFMREIGNRPGQGKPVEQALVGVSGAFAPALLFFVYKELYSLTVRERLRPNFHLRNLSPVA